MVQPCVLAAETLRQAVLAAPSRDEPTAEAVAVSGGSHPLAILLRLLDPDPEPELADEEWARLYRAVAQAYGRPLAAAAARRRLVIGSAATPETTSAPDAAAPASVVLRAPVPPSRPSARQSPASGSPSVPPSSRSVEFAAPRRPSGMAQNPNVPPSATDLTDLALGGDDVMPERPGTTGKLGNRLFPPNGSRNGV